MLYKFKTLSVQNQQRMHILLQFAYNSYDIRLLYLTDSSLDDIKYVLNPTFTSEHIRQLDNSGKLSRAIDGTLYLPGIVGLNNIKANDYCNVILQVCTTFFRGNVIIWDKGKELLHQPLSIVRINELSEFGQQKTIVFHSWNIKYRLLSFLQKIIFKVISSTYNNIAYTNF